MYVRTYVRMHVYTYVCAVPSYSPTLPSFAVLVGPSAQSQMHWESFILCEWVCTSCKFCRVLIHIALCSQSHHFSIGTVESCMISYDTNDEYCPYQERSNTRCTPWGRHVRTYVQEWSRSSSEAELKYCPFPRGRRISIPWCRTYAHVSCTPIHVNWSVSEDKSP